MEEEKTQVETKVDVPLVHKNYFKLFFSFIIIVLYVLISFVIILKSSYEEFSPIVNYLIFILFSGLAGLLFKNFQEGYDSSYNYGFKISVIVSTIFLTNFVVVIGIMNEIAKVVDKLSVMDGNGSGMSSLISVFDVNLFLFAMLVLLSFNFKYLISYFEKKDYIKYLYYLIPFIVSFGLYYLLFLKVLTSII